MAGVGRRVRQQAQPPGSTSLERDRYRQVMYVGDPGARRPARGTYSHVKRERSLSARGLAELSRKYRSRRLPGRPFDCTQDPESRSQLRGAKMQAG